MRITECRVNHMENPVGFRFASCTFSWKVEDAQGARQAWARIRVRGADGRMVYDSREREDLDSLGAAFELTLEPETVYCWTVTVKTDAGEVAESPEQRFETGKMGQPWHAAWITCRGEETLTTYRRDDHGPDSIGSGAGPFNRKLERRIPRPGRNPVFGKTFECRGIPVKRARLYICGLGLYRAALNGRKVGDEYLTPYCNEYRTYVQYQTYDITGDLLPGTNNISVELADGWYRGRFGYDQNPDWGCHYGTQRKLIAEIRILYEDGREERIGTDSSWRVARSHITFAGIYDGEWRDDTLPDTEEEDALLLDASDAAKLHLEERTSIPVKARRVIHPVALIDTPAAEKVMDLGENIAGTFRLRVNEPRGTVIHVQVGEVLQNGSFYRDNLRTARAEYYYISDGAEHILEPQFTYYGYRYARIDGVRNLRTDDFEGVVLCSDIPVAGSLRTGDALVNKLLGNIRRGEECNFIDVPTDCPQRDERLGWTADTQVFVPTASYLSDTFAFYRKYLQDIRAEQAFSGGAVPYVIPSFHVTGSAAVWGDAAAIIPWTLYLYYGDRRILEESLGSMEAWVDYISRVDGTDHHWSKVYQLGDWLALDNPDRRSDQTAGGTDEGFIANIYYMYSAELTAKAADVLSGSNPAYKKDAEKYRALAERQRTYILKEYFTENGRCLEQTQTGLTLALMHHLTTDRKRTMEDLRKVFALADDKLQTGFVGTPFVMEVLSEEGESELACHLLHNEEYPGWLYEVRLGATTVWERWNSMNPDGSVSSTGMNSFNHYAYGSVGEWMWQNLAGIRPTEEAPGFRKAVIRPLFDRKSGEAHAVYDSPAGKWKIDWKYQGAGDTVDLKIDVPFGCTAQLDLSRYTSDVPVRELTPGHWDFEIPTGAAGEAAHMAAEA